MTHDFREACDLVARTRAGGRLFAITHGYSAYPMTRYARHLVRDGSLGPVRLVQVEYIQSGLATRLEDGPQNNRLRWILDPQRSGLALVMSAIGCHAQHLACVRHRPADVARVVRGRRRAGCPAGRWSTTCRRCVEFDGGARGTFTATQAAAGGENDIRLRVYGERGWSTGRTARRATCAVALQGEPARVDRTRRRVSAAGDRRAGRAPRGHPEGLREAFANIYGEVAQQRMAVALGRRAAGVPPIPRIDDGVHTMAFIEACLASQRSGRWEDVARLPD